MLAGDYSIIIVPADISGDPCRLLILIDIGPRGFAVGRESIERRERRDEGYDVRLGYYIFIFHRPISSEELDSHFRTAHLEPESNEAVSSFKDIFSKAKKKLLKDSPAQKATGVNGRDREGSPAFPKNFSYVSSKQNHPQHGSQCIFSPTQSTWNVSSLYVRFPHPKSQLDIPEQNEAGVVVNHTEIFRKSRSNRVQRYNAQMNNLVVRLKKLLAPGTPIGNDKKRREFEQQVKENKQLSSLFQAELLK